jgi:hypothetical protein
MEAMERSTVATAMFATRELQPGTSQAKKNRATNSRR